MDDAVWPSTPTPIEIEIVSPTGALNDALLWWKSWVNIMRTRGLLL